LANFRETPSLRVLIVDDNVDVTRSLAMLCEQMGHKTECAHDGRGAIDAAHRRKPDVILLDLALPGGMDGFEVTRRLRADPALRGVLIIAVTGLSSEEDRQRAREAGVDYHLVKPADPAFIASLLRRRL
jgi:CheY-like chemotaxis protein